MVRAAVEGDLEFPQSDDSRHDADLGPRFFENETLLDVKLDVPAVRGGFRAGFHRGGGREAGLLHGVGETDASRIPGRFDLLFRQVAGEGLAPEEPAEPALLVGEGDDFHRVTNRGPGLLNRPQGFEDGQDPQRAVEPPPVGNCVDMGAGEDGGR